MLKLFVAAAMSAATAASASAIVNYSGATGPLHYLDGTVAVSGARLCSPVGTTYGVFTGLATAANALALIEPTAPAIRDDIVNFDGVSESINDYVAAAGSITRTVTESYNVGTGALSVKVNASGELFPSGFSSGGVPLTGAAFGIGLGLPASLGGADPLTWGQGTNVLDATLSFFDANGAQPFGPFNIFSLFTNPWNGVLGVAISNATGRGITMVQLDMHVTKIPTPSAAALFGVAGLIGARRRRA